MYTHPHVTIKFIEEQASMPAAQWLTTNDVKDHLRVDFNDDNDYIGGLIDAAQHYIESYCDFKFGRCSFEAYWDYGYPIVNITKLGNLYGTPTFSALNDAGTYVALDASTYSIDGVGNPKRVHMKNISNYTSELNTYKLEFVTEVRELPDYVVQAALMIIGHWYENRQDVGTTRVFEIPMNSKFFLDRFREQSFV
jgi:uncharacterized phiE125 gp8 family phage protein